VICFITGKIAQPWIYKKCWTKVCDRRKPQPSDIRASKCRIVWAAVFDSGFYKNKPKGINMAEFASTQNTGNLIKFIETIPDRGNPTKVTIQHLEGLGYKSTNDRAILTVLKFIDLIGSDGKPNEHYRQMRNRGAAKKYLAALVRKAYSGLFETYPDANVKDGTTLDNYFASNTDVGEASRRNIIKTFSALSNFADFSGGHTDLAQEETGGGAGLNQSKPGGHHKALPKTEVHFDIQIHLPGDQKPEVYESIFKNLGKYVLGNKDE
jgi:Family of unknown function (DUF5343)